MRTNIASSFAVKLFYKVIKTIIFIIFKRHPNLSLLLKDKGNQQMYLFCYPFLTNQHKKRPNKNVNDYIFLELKKQFGGTVKDLVICEYEISTANVANSVKFYSPFIQAVSVLGTEIKSVLTNTLQKESNTSP